MLLAVGIFHDVSRNPDESKWICWVCAGVQGFITVGLEVSFGNGCWGRNRKGLLANVALVSSSANGDESLARSPTKPPFEKVTSFVWNRVSTACLLLSGLPVGSKLKSSTSKSDSIKSALDSE